MDPDEIEPGNDYYFQDTPGSMTERLDQISMFLEGTKTRGYPYYEEPRRALGGKELSIGHVKEDHMGEHLQLVGAILELLNEVQVGLAFDLIKRMQSEFKISMSIDGKFIENVTKQELRYSHEQHVYGHSAPDYDRKKTRRSFWRR